MERQTGLETQDTDAPERPTETPEPDKAPGQTVPVAKSEPIKAVLDDAAIQKLAEVFRNQASAAAGQPSPTLSPEEVARMFHVYTPDANLVKALRELDEEQAVRSLQDMVNGIVRYATTLAQYQMGHQLHQLIGQLQPLFQTVEQMQLERLKGEFFEQYPDLKGYEPLLGAIRDGFVSSGRKFSSKEEAFKALAEEARKIIQNLPGAQGRNGSGTKPPPSLASDRPGGSAGNGGNASAGSVEKLARELFG